jgi:hypothetical protein
MSLVKFADCRSFADKLSLVAAVAVVEKNQNQMDVKECVEICLNTQVLLVNYD